MEDCRNLILTTKLFPPYGQGLARRDKTDKFREELRARRQADNESLQSLYSDIQLTTKAFPQANAEIRRVLGKDAFLQAMQDQECSLKIRKMDVGTLEDAYKHAVRLQDIYKSVKQRGETSQQCSAVRDKTTQHSDQNTLRALQQRIDQLEEMCSRQPFQPRQNRYNNDRFSRPRVFGQTANSSPSFPNNRNHDRQNTRFPRTQFG
jgi:hypothetical protein